MDSYTHNKKKTQLTLHHMTITAMLSAISTVLMFLSFSVPFAPSFLKLDFSELPALLASFTLGSFYGVAVVLIKNLINVFFTTTGGIGELANFMIGSAFVFSAGAIYKYKKTKLGALVGMLSGTVVMAIIGTLANYLLLMPMYSLIMPMDAIINLFQSINPYADSLLKIMFITIVPFNLVKGLLVSVITYLLYKKLSVLIKRKFY